LYAAGIDFNALEQMSITLTGSSESGCVMITTVFDGQTNMDKQFQILLQQPSASTEPNPPIYMPNTTNIIITNRTSHNFEIIIVLFICWGFNQFYSSSSNNNTTRGESEHWEKHWIPNRYRLSNYEISMAA
jgi:hypothetical protein